VLEVRVSASRPTQGWVRMRNTTYNQEDQPVQSFVANLVVPRRDLP
jgi:acyl dehydratase